MILARSRLLPFSSDLVSRRRCAAALVLLLALPLAAAAEPKAAAPKADEFKNGVFDPPRMAPDFELLGSNGGALKLSQYRGKVVALAFGFTHCQKVCPLTLANLASVSRQLGKEASALQVVYVTVDPARDDAARMKEFLGLFNPGFVGGTGSSAQVDAVRAAYGVTAQREAGEIENLGYQVHHSSSVYLIDRAGKLRLLVPFGKSPDDIAHDVRLLLKS
ncbi:MAG TPA: SCO family protein [Polyangiales bacterium]|nr:SCO family protein [Polyangiales bacterium]